jgi:hypothetical protein
MDFSILADRRPPWHGHQGYVGTDNYRSPEHLTKGAVPTPASDIFTCGLMLYELLAGRHPYWSEDQADYARLAQGYRAEAPALLGQMPWPANNADVSAALHRCLDPDPAKRPTAAELRATLSGRNREITSPAPAVLVAAPRAAAASAPSRPVGVPLAAASIKLTAQGGKTMQIGVRTELGKLLMRQFGTEAEFWDERQCVLERSAAGKWTLHSLGSTTNQTLLNGKALVGSQTISDGDQIAVGNEAKKIVKLPLIVRSA